MATVKGGFLGDLSGSVGNITFARARGGIRTARIRATPSNPRSQAQQKQRGRFKQIQQFASALLDAGLVRPFWRPYARRGLSATTRQPARPSDRITVTPCAVSASVTTTVPGCDIRRFPCERPRCGDDRR